MKLHFLNNQRGSTLLIAVLILTLMVIIAAAMNRSTTLELQIVRNDLEQRQQFYFAESAVREAAQEIENLEPVQLMTHPGIISDPITTLNPEDTWWTQAMWEVNGDLPPGSRLRYAMVDNTGVIDLSAPSNLHEFNIYGLYEGPDGFGAGRSVVEIGYRRRF